MKDPLEALEDSLAYMFELQTNKTGNYIHPSVQKLKKALEDYKNGPSLSLRELIAAIKVALPVIENYVDGYIVKLRMETLAQTNGVFITWDRPKTRGVYSNFQFFAPAIEIRRDFISWLSSHAGLEFSRLKSTEKLEIMLTLIGEPEFMTKLAEHLLKNPNFLCNLILDSPEIFIKVINTSLGFQLENHHIAKAIAHHCDALVDTTLEPQEQIESYIEFLDDNLTGIGRSIEKLLEDPLAKAELDRADIFQYYFNEERFNL
ncbi:hypothetical protein [Legionella brunensis]|uniref:Uncharacterized protein n=1 Tax=Legionella brunensis TaxID=29422 RepID=A0A0W0S4E9_9GAMM|nr:hypothetical protein [Legionella brunensis]KTC78366.1 hypothetical protein Lbru_2658 [Legionella brunensis]